MSDDRDLGLDDGEPGLELVTVGRAEQRRQDADRIAEGGPREGVAIFRPVQKAVLVALHRGRTTAHEVEASLDELELLADTMGAEAVARVVQRRSEPDVATFVGRGKLDELKGIVGAMDADAVIFDDELSPAQQRNLEEKLQVVVLDRTIVILNIFAEHATSREGKAQVELAQYGYLLPRLRGWGKALSRIGGGAGPMRGPGETQLEVDRRKIMRRITKLRRDLKDFERTRQVKSSERERHGVPVVALVGYTNAGKSTLMNQLTGANVLVADQLFATLDTTARKLGLPDQRDIVLMDTVGFVKKLPTQLVEAFKSTLEEALRADLLLHVVDASHPEAEAQILAVDRVLGEIGADTVGRLLVFNKADAADSDELRGMLKTFPDALAVSAVTGEGVPALLQRVGERLPQSRRVLEALVPYRRSDLVARVHREGEVLKEEHRDEGTYLVANLDRDLAEALREFAENDPFV